MDREIFAMDDTPAMPGGVIFWRVFIPPRQLNTSAAPRETATEHARTVTTVEICRVVGAEFRNFKI